MNRMEMRRNSVEVADYPTRPKHNFTIDKRVKGLSGTSNT